MIQEIKVKNFRSFKDEVVLSFEATRDTSLEENYVVEVAPGVRLLRFAMVMGANASGKSNLLFAIDYLREWWFCKTESLEESTGMEPFLLDSDKMNEPTEMELRFWIKGIKYCYYLKADSKQVYQERLQMYKTVQPTLVFNRELVNGHSELNFNPAVEKVSEAAIEKIQLECLNNMSFFAARQKVNLPLTVIDEVRDWMLKAITPIITPNAKMFNWSIGEFDERPEVLKHIIEFLRDSDFNITDILSKKQTTEIPEQILNFMLNAPGMPADEKERMKNERTINEIEIKFNHHVINHRGEEDYKMSDDCQSYGTRRVIGMEAAIYEATKDNGFLNIDEFDASMHLDLILYVLRRFLKQNSSSQMLITTHCTPLLSYIDKMIRKDSVWFTERGKDGASDLYSLVEFKGLNRMSSIQNAYMDGKFGARPNIVINNYYNTPENTFHVEKGATIVTNPDK